MEAIAGGVEDEQRAQVVAGRVGREDDLGDAVAGEVGDHHAAGADLHAIGVGVRPDRLGVGADRPDPAVEAGEHHLGAGPLGKEVGDRHLVGDADDVGAVGVPQAPDVVAHPRRHLPGLRAGAVVVHHPERDAAQAIVLRGVLHRAEDDQLAGAVAVEIGDRGGRVGEVALLVDRLVVGVALLGEPVVDHHADAEELGAVVEDRRGVEGAPGAVVQAQVRVVLGREDVDDAVAVDVAERDVLVVAAGDVAGVVAARHAAGVGREALHRRAVRLDRDDDVTLAAALDRRVGHRDQLERAVAVDVAGGERAHLVGAARREAGQRRAGRVEREDRAARRDRDLEAGPRRQEIDDHRRRPDPPAGRGAPQLGRSAAAVEPPHHQELVARQDDLDGAVVVEISDRRRRQPALVPAIRDRVGQGGLADRGGPSAGCGVARRRGQRDRRVL